MFSYIAIMIGYFQVTDSNIKEMVRNSVLILTHSEMDM